MKKNYYGYLEFNKEGNFRGFGSGFFLKDFKKFVKEITESGNLIIPFKGNTIPKNIPNKFIESYYWKVSQNNDLSEVLKLMPFKL